MLWDAHLSNPTHSSLHTASLALIAFISIHGSLCAGVQIRLSFILGDSRA
jgi:hypothetical protein